MPRSRPSGHCELPPFELLEEHRQRAIEHDGEVAIRHGVPQKILGTAQLVVQLARGGELDLVALGCKWRDDCWSRRRERHPRRRVVGFGYLRLSGTGLAHFIGTARAVRGPCGG
jgi:hypothetical protein